MPTIKRINPARIRWQAIKFASIWLGKPDVLAYAEGATSPKMMSVGLHCRLVGRPGRAASLMRFLDYIGRHERVWVPTRLQIAQHWHAHLNHLAENAFIIG